MVEITYQMVLNTLQTVSLMVGVFYYFFIMRNSQRAQQLQLETRQAQLFMQIFMHNTDPDFRRRYIEMRSVWEWDDYEDYQSKYGGSGVYSKTVNPDTSSTLSAVSYYLEGRGVLVKRGLIAPHMVDDLISGDIILIWEKFRPIVLEDRRRTGHFEAWEHIEYLYNIIKPLREKQRQDAELSTS